MSKPRTASRSAADRRLRRSTSPREAAARVRRSAWNRRTTSRRNFLSLAVGARRRRGPRRLRQLRPRPAPAAAAAAAAAPPATGPSPASPARRSARTRVDRFNKANPNSQDQRHDVPERRLQDEDQDGDRRRPGARRIIWGWGGGGLKSYVEAGQVEDLTVWFGENAAVKDRLFPSSFGAATVDGKIYAMPVETVAADRPVLQQEGLRQGRRAAAAVVGRHHGPGAQVQRRRASRRSRSAGSRAGPT